MHGDVNWERDKCSTGAPSNVHVGGMENKLVP